MGFRVGQHASRQGSSLAIYSAGTSGPAIFVVGGITRSTLPETNLGRVLDAAANFGARVTMMDLAGSGDSRFSGRLTMDGMVRDAAEIYCRYVNERGIWIGTSMGGWIMLALHRANPAWFRSMGALAPAIDWDSNYLLPARKAGKFIETPGGLESEGMVLPYELVESMAGFRLGGTPYPLETPLHIIHGAADELVPASAVTAFAADLGPRCTFDLLPGDGHDVSKLKSDESLFAFGRWLRSAIDNASAIPGQVRT